MTKADQPLATRDDETAPVPPAGGRGGRFGTIGLIALATAAGAVAGALALYGMNRLHGNAPAVQTAGAVPAAAAATDQACKGAVEAAASLKGLAKGEIAAMAVATEPRRLPPLTFADAEGKPVSLADFKGRLLLVNLWATWCVPCRKEMPSLDRLQGTLGGPDFQVVAINLDTKGPEKPRAFLSEIGVSHLAFFTDPATKTFQALRGVGRGVGLPTTLIVDRSGCELAYLAGPAEWASEEAQAFVKAAAEVTRSGVVSRPN
ncbi:thiol:disulfide interchange protein TlpA [Xanthobacter nonsaccharivorans]|uniref:thiol:disulfide interchange protein TlpA n=1 Tax=Xanthobacter nonsaccharivorans TaxID=3119912 RepID=UPI00372D0456